MGVGSLIGGLAGASSSASGSAKGARALENAAQLSTQAQKEMFNTLMALQMPYHNAGVEALNKLRGGAGDPTGGAGQYMQSMPNFSYSFDENDPAYQFKLKEAQKAIDAATASRGNYNSRAAINASSEAQQAITSEEVDKQFGRSRDIYNIDYGRNLDLFNMATRLGGLDYSTLMDLIKVGQGSASSAGQGAVATGQGLSSAYMNMGSGMANAYQNIGNTWGNFYAGAGSQPMRDWTTYMAFGGGMGGGR